MKQDGNRHGKGKMSGAHHKGHGGMGHKITGFGAKLKNMGKHESIEGPHGKGDLPHK